MKEVRYVSKITCLTSDTMHNPFDIFSPKIFSPKYYNLLLLPLKKTLKFKFCICIILKFCICIILSYGFSLCALKCTNLTYVQPIVKRPKSAQPPVNDLLINLLILRNFAQLTNQSTSPHIGADSTFTLIT